MFANFKFMGNLKNDSDVEPGFLPKGAIRFDKQISGSKETVMSYFISAPILLPIFYFGVKKFYFLNSLPNSPTILTVLFVDALCLIALIPFLFIHEIIHGLCFPYNAKKEIWYRHRSEEFNFLLYCNAPLSKLRYIIMCLAPTLILGVFPYMLWINNIFDFNILFSLVIGVAVLILIVGGAGDIYSVYLILRYVPKEATGIIAYGTGYYYTK